MFEQNPEEGKRPVDSRRYLAAGLQGDRWVAPLMLGAMVFSLVSIFLSYVFFVAGLVVWGWDCYQRGRIHLEFPPFTLLLGSYVALILVSIIFSSEPLTSAVYLKKLIKVFSIFLIYTYATRQELEFGLKSIFWIMSASGLYGVLQYFWLKPVDLLHRIDGFMSHWMTFSGQLMMVSVALGGYLLYLGGIRMQKARSGFLGYSIILLVVGFALILTFTRSAWIGCACGFLVMLAIRKVKWAIGGGLVLLIIFLFLPAPFIDRFYSSFDLSDTTTRGRVELLKTGINLIRDNPLTGVGPRMVAERALEYREDRELPDELYQHFHSNLVQIAAEMGVPAAIVWMLLWIWVVRDFLIMRRNSSDPFLDYLLVNGISVLVAVQLAGLLEYNFGDSEIAILLFFFVTAPYAAKRGRRLAT